LLALFIAVVTKIVIIALIICEESVFEMTVSFKKIKYPCIK